MELLQRLHHAVDKRIDQLVEATAVEYGAPQDRAKGSNNLAANIFLHFKKVLEDFYLAGRPFRRRSFAREALPPEGP
jgi:aldehyde dehydrogenase (NAD+)